MCGRRWRRKFAGLPGDDRCWLRNHELAEARDEEGQRRRLGHSVCFLCYSPRKHAPQNREKAIKPFHPRCNHGLYHGWVEQSWRASHTTQQPVGGRILTRQAGIPN